MPGYPKPACLLFFFFKCSCKALSTPDFLAQQYTMVLTVLLHWDWQWRRTIKRPAVLYAKGHVGPPQVQQKDCVLPVLTLVFPLHHWFRSCSYRKYEDIAQDESEFLTQLQAKAPKNPQFKYSSVLTKFLFTFKAQFREGFLYTIFG